MFLHKFSIFTKLHLLSLTFSLPVLAVLLSRFLVEVLWKLFQGVKELTRE